MIADQARTNSMNLVGTDRGAHTAPADRYPAYHLAGRYRASQRNYEIGVVVAGFQAVRPEVLDLMSSRPETGQQILL